MVKKDFNNIKKEVDDYYSTKISEYGATSSGVDWNGEKSQYIRFQTLAKVIQEESFSILDYGCGYGEFVNYLSNIKSNWNYSGFDISEKMIEMAKQTFPDHAEKFKKDIKALSIYDYTIASGIFNVKNEINEEDWLDYIISELKFINTLSKKGFAFNVLTSYSDHEYKKDYLYYADPMYLFDFCKKHFSKNVALLHDYDLYEFTLIIRK